MVIKRFKVKASLMIKHVKATMVIKKFKVKALVIKKFKVKALVIKKGQGQSDYGY